MSKYLNLLNILGFFVPLVALANSSLCFADEVQWVSYKDLHPTQFTVGRFEIELKKQKFAELSASGREEYLAKKVLQVVVSPDGQYYLIDGHHTAIALVESGYTHLPIEIVEDFSKAPKLSEAQFWDELKNRAWIYLYENGEERTNEQLVPLVTDLKDDPFRSLAWILRQIDIFENLKLPFQEFFWADFLRAHLSPVSLKTTKDFQKIIPKAIALIDRIQPQHLPGFKNIKSKHMNKCGRLLKEKFSISFKPIEGK